MKRNLFLTLLLAVMLIGCLNFGENIELSGEEVDGAVLDRVTELTGVIFPDGVVGEEYVYFGEGIDDTLAIKVSIPKDKKEEFLMNKIFTEGQDEKPYIPLNQNKNWWKVESLTDPVYTGYDFPNGYRIECSVGEESGKIIIYLHWITF